MPNRALLCLLFLAFINMVGISLPYPVLAPMFVAGELPTLGSFSPVLSVMIVMSLYPFGQFIGAPVLGYYSDRIGSRRVISWSMSLTSLGYLASAFAIFKQDIIFFCLTRFMTGIVEGNFGVLRAEVAKISSNSAVKLKYFGYFQASATIAWLLGPLLGSLLVNKNISAHFTPSHPFLLGAVISLAGAFASSFFLAESKQRKPHRKSFIETLNEIRKVPEAIVMLILSFLVTLSVDGFYEYYPTFLANKLKSSSQNIAFITIFMIAGMIFSQLIVIPRLKHQLLSFVSPAALLAIGIIMLTITSSPYLGPLGFLICGIGIGTLTTLVPAFVSDNAPDDLQGAVMGIMASMRSLGDTIVCLGLGILGEQNIYYPLFLIALTTILAAQKFGRLAKSKAC